MQQAVREWLDHYVPGAGFNGPVVEIGSRPGPGDQQAAWANLRPLFPDLEYVGVDVQAGPNVDLVCPAETLDLPDSFAGTVVSIDALEHIWDVRRALGEMYRILKPAGRILVSSVFIWHIHGHPDDYWRFTPSCLQRLLGEAGFQSVRVEAWGEARNPVQVIGEGTK